MFARRTPLVPIDDRGPLRVMFINTCMTMGGQETLLVELIRRLDRSRFTPELCCLKYFGTLGEMLSREVPSFTGLLKNKFDVAVWGRLTRLFRERRIDAVITVGTGGDRMFWGRLAAWRAGVPVIASAIHSTGYPTYVEWSNRRLAPLTDAFIAVAEEHGRYIAEHEGCPAAKVRVIPNGVDVARFSPQAADAALRDELRLPAGSPVAGLVAELRPEKNHRLWLQAAAEIHRQMPEVRFLLVGGGPLREELESLAAELGLADVVRFAGRRMDVPELLRLIDVFVLTSDMEANPVSILEAMACGKPVIASRVGSIPETVTEGQTGYLVDPGQPSQVAERLAELLRNPQQAAAMGRAGREWVVTNYSVERMVRGYEDLMTDIYSAKCRQGRSRRTAPAAPSPAAAIRE